MQPEYSDDAYTHDDPLDYPAGMKPPAARPESPVQPGMAPRPVRVPLRMPDVRPRFTFALLGIIVLIYIAGQAIPIGSPRVIYGMLVSTAEDWMFVYGAKINELIFSQHQVYRLFTAMFLHGGLEHLFFNGYALYVIGQGVERLYGHARFLMIYFLSGLTGSLASLAFSPYPSVGASGALFGIFGAEVAFLLRNRRLFGAMARSRLMNLAFVLALNLMIGLAPGSRIDNWGHIGGFVAGLALSWLLSPVFQPVAPTTGDAAIALEDQNPLRERIAVPFLWAAGLVLVTGLLVMTQS
jgi:rhomboid protease GluP